MSRPVAYSTAQMTLHWLVVALVAVQFVFNDSMERALANIVETGGPLFEEGGLVTHAVIGTSIFVAMAIRLVVRLTRGVPPAPETEPRRIQIVSRSVHWAFYALLLGMPVAGALALLLGSATLGILHMLGSWLLLALIVAHVAGAVWHMTKSGSRAHKRMLAREPAEVPLD